MVQADQITGRATLDALIPLYDQLKRRGTVRQETVTDALRAWCRLVPAQGRLSLRTEQRGRHAQIEEVRLLTSKFRNGAWSDGAWEPGLTLVAIGVLIAPRDCRFIERSLAGVSLHALARRFERGRDGSDAAVIRDLAALAAHHPDRLPASAFRLRAPSGWWAGEVLPVSGEALINVRTFYDSEAWREPC